jgi:Xaa-Pro aminopeptidase
VTIRLAIAPAALTKESSMTERSTAKIELFDRSEYQRRLLQVKERMAVEGLELLLLASPANHFWLTGYDGWSFYTPQMVLVHVSESEPIWFGRKMDAVGARFTVYMGEDRIVPYPDEYVASRERHAMQFLAGIIRDRGWGRAHIGVEMDDYYYTARWHQILTHELPNARFHDAFLLVNWCRLKKSTKELQYMKEAGRISAASILAAVDAVEIGVRQCDVMAALYRVTIGGTPDVGGTFPCKPPNAMVNEICSAPHLSWSDAPLQKNDMFYIEQGGVRHRYHSPLSRCVYLGRPSQKMLDTTRIIVEGLEAVLSTVRPGVTLEELEAAWRRTIARYGIEKDSRIGYPVGIGYPPTWGELTCSMRRGDGTVLEPGMTFHCIPALWLESYGLVVSETFVVTDRAAEVLADCPRKLFHKDA